MVERMLTRPRRTVALVATVAVLAAMAWSAIGASDQGRGPGSDRAATAARPTVVPAAAALRVLPSPPPALGGARSVGVVGLLFLLVIGLVGRRLRRIGDVGDDWRALLEGAPPALA